jgi:predicted dehydrogenase
MLKVAAVGVGWVTINRHIPSLLRHPRVKLVGVIDRDPQKAAAAAKKLGVLSGDSLTAPWMSQVEAVTLGTPPDTHAELTHKALGHGLHVLTEKPFAMSPAEAAEMIAAAKEAKRTLAVVHNFQFARSVAAARQRFATGAAGELRAILGLQLSSHARRLPTWYQQLPCGLFYDEAPHLYYLVKSFLGALPMTSVQVATSIRAGDNTPRLVSTVHDQNGVAGSVQMFFDAALSEWQLVLMGSRETLVADIFRDILIRLPTDGRHEARDILRTSAQAFGGHLAGTVLSGVKHVRGDLDYGNDEVVRRFVTAVETGQPPEGISGDDGLQVVRAMDAVISAAKKA